jgi:hypothetical protein
MVVVARLVVMEGMTPVLLPVEKPAADTAGRPPVTTPTVVVAEPVGMEQEMTPTAKKPAADTAGKELMTTPMEVAAAVQVVDMAVGVSKCLVDLEVMRMRASSDVAMIIK